MGAAILNKLIISERVLKSIFIECEANHPEEACGFLLGTLDEGRKAEEFVPCKNIQNKLHAEDKERYPRDAKTAYVIDSKEQEAVFARAKEQGLEVVSIVHSHPEHGAYFSDEDKKNAAPWGEPLFPNMSYLVVSVYGKKVKTVADFYWSEEKKDFLEEKIYE